MSRGLGGDGALQAQIANLSSLLSDLGKKQERDWVSVVMQVMDLFRPEGRNGP